MFKPNLTGTAMQSQKSLTCFILFFLFGIYIFIYSSSPKEKPSAWNYFDFSRIFGLFGVRNKSCAVYISDCKVFKCPEFTKLISDWQNVSSDGSVYVYSSFYNEDKITILGAAVETNVSLFCQIWARAEGFPITISIVKATIRYLPDHHNSRYRACFFLCSASGVSTPLAVSLVRNDTCPSPLNVLPVLSRPRSNTGRNFTVCVAPLRLKRPFTNELVEWIELNRILGVEYFVFYNYSKNSNDSQVLQYYSHRGLVEVHPWTLRLRDKIWYYGQMTAINDCIFRHKNNTEFLAIFDLDEFIIPRWENDRIWNDMLQRLPRASSYIFRSVIFPRQIKREGHESGRTTNNTKEYKFITMEKTNRMPEIWPAKRRSKAIHNPRNLDVGGIHYAWSLTRGQEIIVNASIGLVHHYRWWNFDTTDSDTRTLLYKTELTDRVDRTWKEMNLYQGHSFG